MRLELGSNGPTLDGVPVRDPESLEAVLGSPSRTVVVERVIPGAEGGSVPDRVSVWDEAGLVAAPGLLAVAVGNNLLDEPVWPDSQFTGVLVVDGVPLDPSAMARDPLREQRRTSDVGDADLTVITNWRGAPAKVVWTRRTS
jgi:hypothetical protein